MNHRELHDIVQQVAKNLVCAKCKTKLSAKHLKITNIQEKDCYFNVVCPFCEAEMMLSAHIEKTTVKETKDSFQTKEIPVAEEEPLRPYNKKFIKSDKPVSLLDIYTMEKVLEEFCGSFKKVFLAVE